MEKMGGEEAVSSMHCLILHCKNIVYAMQELPRALQAEMQELLNLSSSRVDNVSPRCEYHQVLSKSRGTFLIWLPIS